MIAATLLIVGGILIGVGIGHVLTVTGIMPPRDRDKS